MEAKTNRGSFDRDFLLLLRPCAAQQQAARGKRRGKAVAGEDDAVVDQGKGVFTVKAMGEAKRRRDIPSMAKSKKEEEDDKKRADMLREKGKQVR